MLLQIHIEISHFNLSFCRILTLKLLYFLCGLAIFKSMNDAIAPSCGELISLQLFFQNLYCCSYEKKTIMLILTHFTLPQNYQILSKILFFFFFLFDDICDQSADNRWQKISLLLEFGEWLYYHNFPKANAQHQVQWAIDILLQMETKQAEGPGRTYWLILFIRSWQNSVNY